MVRAKAFCKPSAQLAHSDARDHVRPDVLLDQKDRGKHQQGKHKLRPGVPAAIALEPHRAAEHLPAFQAVQRRKEIDRTVNGVDQGQQMARQTHRGKAGPPHGHGNQQKDHQGDHLGDQLAGQDLIAARLAVFCDDEKAHAPLEKREHVDIHKPGQERKPVVQSRVYLVELAQGSKQPNAIIYQAVPSQHQQQRDHRIVWHAQALVHPCASFTKNCLHYTAFCPKAQ